MFLHTLYSDFVLDTFPPFLKKFLVLDFCFNFDNMLKYIYKS